MVFMAHLVVFIRGFQQLWGRSGSVFFADVALLFTVVVFFWPCYALAVVVGDTFLAVVVFTWLLYAHAVVVGDTLFTVFAFSLGIRTLLQW